MAKKEKNEGKNWFVRHKVWSVILGFIAISVISSAAGGGSQFNTNKNTTSKSSTDKAAEVAKIGQPANDGKFEFTVSSVECGKVSVGTNQYLTKSPQGQYCLLNISVKNIGDQAQSLISSNQYLLNANGQKYSADDSATLYNSPSGSSWYNNINPGNSVSGAIVFDVPKDQTPTAAELHDSAFSNGVKVNLQ
jgi:hypothetical protein